MTQSDCPTPMELAQWIGNRLPPDRRKEIALHLKGCPPCRVDVELAGTDIDAAASGRPSADPASTSWRVRIWPAAQDDPDEPASLAAATDGSRSVELPSIPIDAERNLLHFRVDRSTGAVTAHLVCRTPDEQAYRPLLVADRLYVTDKHGSVSLAPLGVADLLAVFVEAPAFMAEWRLDPEIESSPSGSAPLRPLPAPDRGVAPPEIGRYSHPFGGERRSVTLEFSRPGCVVVVLGESVTLASRVRMSEPIDCVLGVQGKADPKPRVILYV